MKYQKNPTNFKAIIQWWQDLMGNRWHYYLHAPQFFPNTFVIAPIKMLKLLHVNQQMDKADVNMEI